MCSKSCFKKCSTNLEAKGARNIPRFARGGPLIVRGRLTNEQLRFVCAGASAKRVGPSRKTGKSEENEICESKHTYNFDVLRKVARRIGPKLVKVLLFAH